MKPTILAAALALSFATSAAFAQMPAPTAAQQSQAPQATPQQDTAPQHAMDPHKAAMRIGRQLNLAPDQTAKLEPILAERQQKVMALRADTSLTEMQKKKQMRTVLMGARLQLANVLTPDQMKQLKNLRQDRQSEAIL